VERILPRRDTHASDELRWLYGLGGAALVIWGWRRRSWLGAVLSSAGLDLLNWSCTGHYLHETLGVTSLTRKGLRALVPHQLGIKVDLSIAVYRPVDEVYRFFRNFKNLSRFMAHVNDVRESDDKHSHWFVKGPGGMELEWDAEIIEDQPNELISWRSIGSPDVESAGSVRFERAPGERGTGARRLKFPGVGRTWRLRRASGLAGQAAGHQRSRFVPAGFQIQPRCGTAAVRGIAGRCGDEGRRLERFRAKACPHLMRSGYRFA